MKNLGLVLISIMLSACGNTINANGTANIGTGDPAQSSLLAGPCGLWEIAGEYEDGVKVSGACEVVVEGRVAVINDSYIYDDDFRVAQDVLVTWGDTLEPEILRIGYNGDEITIVGYTGQWKARRN